MEANRRSSRPQTPLHPGADTNRPGPVRRAASAGRSFRPGLIGTVVLGGLLVYSDLRAQVVTFDTSGDSQAASINATKNATQQGAITGTPQLQRFNGLSGTGGAAGSFFSNAGGNNTNTLNLNTSPFVGFSATPMAGSVIFATGINFTSQGSGTAPNSYATAYSTDGFSTATQMAFTGTTSTSAVVRNYNIPDLITNDPLSVRFYNYGATGISSASSPTGSFRVITPTVTGSTVTASNGAISLAADTEVRNSTALTLGGVIFGASAITKTGAGTLTLTGNNSFGTAGATGVTVSAGTLLVNNTAGSGTGAGNVVVNNSGSILGGSGTISGTVTVNSGARLQGGNGSVGTTLTLSQNPVLNSGSLIELALGSGGTRSTLALAAGGFDGFNSNQAFVLDNFQTGTYDNVITGVASGIVTSGWTVTGVSPNAVYTFTDDGSNIDLTVTAVPEPATVAAGLLALGTLGWSQRRRVRGFLAVRRPLPMAA